MDTQCNALLGWSHYSHQKTTEEIRQSLLYTTLELDQTKMFAYEEIRKRDEQLNHLKDILTKTIKERDEALEKCQHLMFSLQQQKHILSPPLSGASSIEDEQVKPQQLVSNRSFSSSDCEESIMSPTDYVMKPPQSQLEEVSRTEIIIDPLVPDRPLPEKGKLLQSVIKAGPLLQTLLLAGPLPQWRHPPPPLKTFEIPPLQSNAQFLTMVVANSTGKEFSQMGPIQKLSIRKFFSTDREIKNSSRY